ncbi:flagellar biosynthesis regulator FlhF [Roseobacter denitrificans]|uniref:Flagellar protein, putative n=1 Tax=Roseobacter denitrificans (strain ATCC 33942 / OCh 114) TaxID=375451 RepID=Q16DQ1_ROSDO|nr:flagellar biosynthesis regulator FlaF [Roseobacter denitrificans]ABG29892.1 flagellar protein, putative [Roseobacter denitrificans OCh 114]AVL53106.1 flagellar biosynthesis regulator FlhF [Roseobacter denitrificans]SFG37770.1 flagellar protein FlaF [Roseobacter denitrificans OCh 114]
MNSFAQAQRAYAPTQAPIKTARSTEYEVIARISHRMKRAMQQDDFPALAEALHENNKLWTTLAIDVGNPDNLLPDELRARIVYLADFTRQHSHKVMRKTETAVPLLEINAAILKGLKHEVSGK